MQPTSATSVEDMHFKIKDEFVEEVIDIESEATIWGTQEALTSETRNQDMVFLEEGFTVIKEEVPEGAVSLLDLFPAYAAPAHASYGKNVNPKQRGIEPVGLFMVKKLLQLTVPKKHVSSRWSKHTTDSILKFLKSFATVAQGCSRTHSADKSLALRGPRILKCEECFVEFSGVYDKYLKLFSHYKRDHGSKCNVLIGRRWNKHMTSLDLMVQAWKMDLKYESVGLTY
ncbi:uncharacterized protein LOC127751061 [Frankliniella occidentalis]|uniref:Uncharacterized protein LOC127751061 n=1 Tax=Frankliniella occidentalis TaxID=133901 RepID=A0A9C6X6B0_FRAOC|nr:uncharacterized protein LOC127751061 [Frankliniella occidentalis]XP_052129979.1 uncharacterized protein LOC127751061 [Frankliniella occidentalis]XP_052129980.1 uncharacterized protein LOC127751061 [Frankliniella occidentalis]